jgi:hypothetical protein
MGFNGVGCDGALLGADKRNALEQKNNYPDTIYGSWSNIRNVGGSLYVFILLYGWGRRPLKNRGIGGIEEEIFFPEKGMMGL